MAELDLSLFLGDRYLCIDMGDGGVALGWCWLRLVANSNAEACCIFTLFEEWCEVGCMVRGKVLMVRVAAGLAALLVPWPGC